MTAPGRRALRTVGWTAAVVVSAAIGWVARGAGSEPRAATAPPHPIVDDARATRHAAWPPVEVAIAQLAAPSRRTAPARALQWATPAADASPGTGPGARPEAGCAPAAADADALVQAIAQAGAAGGGQAGVDALLRARVAGVPVPDALLRELIESAPSDRVRLAAMASWLEARVGDPRIEREALESLIVVPNAAVQHDLRRRLAELDEMDRLEALAAHGVAEPP